MKAKDAVLYWNPRGPEGLSYDVEVANINSHADRSGYVCSSLAAWTEYRETDDIHRLAFIFIEAVHLMVRDGVHPKNVHDALLSIDEYRTAIAPDLAGSEASDEFPGFGLRP
jgi:hypothetical protein